MDLLLGVAPKPAPAANLAEPLDGHALPALLEETGDLLPAEPLVADVTGETPAGGPVEATETTGLPAADTVIETVEPELPPAPKKARRSRKRAPAAATETGSAPAEAAPAGEAVVAASPSPVETPAGRQLRQAQSSRRREPDEVLEPAYVPIKITVSIPAVVLSELIRTVQTIRRMTGRRQPVNQGTVIAAALEMAFEEFRTKGATSQLVDKLRDEG